MAFTLCGGFVVESVFSIPGLGRYFVQSIQNRDYPVIMGTTIFLAAFIILMNLVVDLLYKVADRESACERRRMIVAEDKKIKKCPVSLQPDIENLLQDLSPDDFASASRQEKDDFIQDRQSVSYWKDAWRRLKKNVVAMVALGVIVFLFLFAFVGPLLIPYGYDEFNKGAENLYPYHYTLEDTQRVNDEIASRTQSDVVDVDEMIAQAKAEAEKKGEKFTKKR